MATADSNKVESLDPSGANPLIVDGGWNKDTASNVRGAIEFIADALTVIGKTGGLTDEAANGAGLLLMCCTAAMRDVATVTAESARA